MKRIGSGLGRLREPRRAGLGAAAALAVLVVASGRLGADAAPGLAIDYPDARSIAVLEAARIPGENALLSPASLAAVVALARAGIDGGGALPDFPDYVATTNAVWLDEGQALSEAAEARLGADWGAHTETLPLGSKGQSRINAWVAEATQGRVPELIDAPLDNVDVVLTNTLYFKDAWTKPFAVAQTAPGRFTRQDGSTVDVDFMTGPATYPSWTVGTDTVVALGFAEGGMLLLRLPGAASEAAALAGTRLALAEASSVQVSLPRLEITANADLTALVRAIGLEPELGEGFATLTAGGTQAGPVLQSVTFTVDEAGAEATAATAAIGTRSVDTEEPPLIVFDRPFDAFLVAPGQPTALIAASIEDPRS